MSSQAAKPAGFSPRFVKSKVSFWVEQKLYTAGEHLINVGGVPGFPWTGFNPVHAVGKKTQVVIEVKANPPFEFTCNGTFTCERTEKATFLGIAFALNEEQKEILETIISREGILPDYVRKFPRIPFSKEISMMPGRMILRYYVGADDIMVVCDVDNLSPSGMQVYTEDRRAAAISAGDVVQTYVQPRGPFEHSILMNGAVKRIVTTVDPRTGNNRWYFGVAVMTISDHNRALLADLLRSIALELKA